MFQHLLAKKLKAYQTFYPKCWIQTANYIGVLFILFSLLTLTGWIHIHMPTVFDMPLPWLLSIFLVVYYFLFDMMFAGVIAVLLIIFNLIITLAIGNAPSWTSFQVFLYALIIGAVAFFVGHLIDKKKPSFKKSLDLALIAPLFLTAELFFYFGQKKDLKKAMEDIHQ